MVTWIVVAKVEYVEEFDNILKIKIEELDNGWDRGLGNRRTKNIPRIFILGKCDIINRIGKNWGGTDSLGGQESIILFCVHIDTKMV